MSSAASRKTAWLLFLALFGLYLAFSPGTTDGRGYVPEEKESGMRMLAVFNAWVKGRAVEPMAGAICRGIPTSSRPTFATV